MSNGMLAYLGTILSGSGGSGNDDLPRGVIYDGEVTFSYDDSTHESGTFFFASWTPSTAPEYLMVEIDTNELLLYRDFVGDYAAYDEADNPTAMLQFVPAEYVEQVGGDCYIWISTEDSSFAGAHTLYIEAYGEASPLPEPSV